MPLYSAILLTPIGKLRIETKQQKVVAVTFLSDDATPLQAAQDAYTHSICEEIQCYFENAAHSFTANIDFNGTPFQQSVWRELQKIPLGHTVTYKMLAEKLKTSPRAIGNACRANPVPVIIPCHRVVGQKGLVGFAGNTTGSLMDIKKWLLEHEIAQRPTSTL
jgi:methylated-DNA-[protein]-cysteine S-methyltransferase